MAQIDISGPETIVANKDFGGGSVRQGTVDGKGHLFVASNFGQLLFMDYSGTGIIDDQSNFVATPFLMSNLDDVAPLSGLGGVELCEDRIDNDGDGLIDEDCRTEEVVGGEIMPISQSALLVAGAFANANWMFYVGGVIAATITAVALRIRAGKNKNN